MKRKLLVITLLLICFILISYNTVFATETTDEPVDSSAAEITDIPDESAPDLGLPDTDLPNSDAIDAPTSSDSDDLIEVSEISTTPEESSVDEPEILTTPGTTLLEEPATISDLESETEEESSTEIVLMKSLPPVEEPTPTIGARSATDEDGNVFLGGNYLEVGISKGGSFGTSAPAPAEFGSHASDEYDYSLGLLMDGDGWDVGNAPTTGDFFLPGSPEERYGIAYELDGKTYQYFKADRNGESSSDFIANTVDASDIEKGLLKAVVTATTPHNVVVENTYSFDVNDKFYRTEVKVTNNGDKQISNVRFFRSFDPDQDVDLHWEYDTYNKVICNPDSSKKGGSDNFAMVVARGAVSLEGFFLLSFDNRARASHGVDFSPDDLYMDGLWVESTPGLPTSSTDESIEMSHENTNGYTLEDNAIAMTFNIGTLAAGETTELSHFSSLDPDVIDSLNKIKEAIAADVEKATDESLTIVTTEGYEYSIDGGETWQTDGTFEGLEPDTEYTILSRPVDGTGSEDEISALLATTKKIGPSTPDISWKIITENSITLLGKDEYEYSIDGGNTWQDNPEFTELEENTVYELIGRIKETDDTMPGKNSKVLTITTLEKSEVDLDDLVNTDVTIELSGTIEAIKINKGSIYDAIGEDSDISAAIANDQKIDIKFIIKDSKLSSKELELVKSKLKNGEAISFTVDMSIELYVDGVFVKNITELETPITYTLTLPEKVLKGARNFAVIRTHENDSDGFEVLRIKDEDGDKKTVTISSNKFSNYTFVYEKTGIASAGTVSSDNNSSTTVTTILSSGPRTGDNIELCISLIAIATLNLIFLSIIERKKTVAF